MRQICLVIFTFIIHIASYGQQQPVTRYLGQYTISLYSDSTYFLKSGYFWIYGNYEWSGDTIFFTETPVFDTVFVIYPDSTWFRLNLSVDTVSSIAGEIKYNRAIFDFDREKKLLA